MTDHQVKAAFVIWAGDQELKRLPLEQALELLSAALVDARGSVEKAEMALFKEIRAMMRRV